MTTRGGPSTQGAGARAPTQILVFKENIHSICRCGASTRFEITRDQTRVFGFGRSDSSILLQLTAAGKTKKIFTHCCLDTTNGGGKKCSAAQYCEDHWSGA